MQIQPGFRGLRGNLLQSRLLLCTLVLLVQGSANAGDWPQILGPHRDGRAENESLLATLPRTGPPLVWQTEVGDGYAGVAVAGKRVVLFHRVEGAEVVECLDAATGKRHWKTPFETAAPSSIDPDKGPRCVPVINEERVFLFGAAGQLHCVSLATGAVQWSRDLARDFNIPDSYFGCGSTPLVEKDVLLLNVGGRGPRRGIAAFSTQTGKTVWQMGEEAASYSSPVTATHDKVRHAIFITRLNLISVDPLTGREQFRHPFGRRGPTVNAASPLVFDGRIFLTASYGVGALCGKFTADSFTEEWSSDEILSSQYSTPVFRDGFLYGIDGREDVGVARLRCIQAQSGKVQWTVEDFGTAVPLLADGKLLLQKTDGTLVLARPDPQGFRSLGTARLTDSTVRALPALSQGRYYIRDARQLKCFDLKP